MRDKKIPLLILTLFFISTVPVFALGEETLTVYYTASLNGNLDGCECKGQPRSGLVKTGYFLDRRDKSRSILLEIGDFFDVREDKLLADYILTSYDELGYTVIGVGDQEFSNGLEALNSYGETYPFLCNNLSVDNGKGLQLYSPLPVIIEREGLSIGVFALIDPDVFYFYPDEITSNILVEDPEEAAAGLVAELEGSRVDIIIGIYHGALEAAQEIARKVPGIDVFLAGHEQRLYDAQETAGTIIVSPGENGNRVGMLELTIRRRSVQKYENSFRYFEYKTAPDLPSIRKKIQDYYVQLTGRLKASGEE